MIAGCYDLHLYCDVPGCASRPPFDERGEAEFTGDETGAQARNRARKKGWWLSRNGTCACPPCARDGHRPADPI